MIIPIEPDINDDGSQATEVICDNCQNYAEYQQKGQQGHVYHLCDECYWQMYENYQEDVPNASEWEFQYNEDIEPL